MNTKVIYILIKTMDGFDKPIETKQIRARVLNEDEFSYTVKYFDISSNQEKTIHVEKNDNVSTSPHLIPFA